MYNNPTNITSGRKVVVQQPIDDRLVFETKSFVTNNINTEAVRYYNGMVIFLKEFNEDYAWLSVEEAESNQFIDETKALLDSNYLYASVFGPQYAGKEYNFYPKKGGLSDVDWTDITNIPNTFPPSAHTHEISEVNQLSQALNDKYDANNPAGYVNASQASAAAPVQSVNTKTGDVTLNKTDIGLSNVDNTSDANKPVSIATQSALNDKVDKVAGKGLSDENYTLAEKNKLTGIEANAQVNTVTSVAGKTGAVTLNANDITETTQKFFNTTFVELDENNSVLRFDVLPGFMYGAVNNKSQVGAFSIDFTDAKIGAVCIIHCGTTEEPSLDDAVFVGGEFIPNDTVIYVTFLGNGVTQYVYANPTSLINYSNSKVQSLGNISGSVTINLDNGDDIVATLTDAVEFTITKPSLQSDEVAFFRLELIGDQAFSFTNTIRSEDGELEAPLNGTLPYVYAGRLLANGNLDIYLAQQSLSEA